MIHFVRAGRPFSRPVPSRFLEPNWQPPDAVRADHPDLPALVAGGSPQNPLGKAALTLAGGRYAIHGTNAPESIGGFVSYGCIRMFNEDILDLLARVRVGTPVEVTP
ncbi:L,D-transpeptidase [Devosia sp.]|uniref:L,D-transpeptidase n=1 Tax=Devosia sp. TaxID=1871048 RepID=UPI003BA8464B